MSLDQLLKEPRGFGKQKNNESIKQWQVRQQMHFQQDTGFLVSLKQDQQADYPAGIKILDQLQPISNDNMKKLKPNALQYDIKLGWMPKSQVTGPIPLQFTQTTIDHILQTKENKLVYLGWRPSNTFEIHKQFYGQGKNYPFNQFHLCKSQFLQRFFKKFYSNFQFESNRQEGMIRIQQSDQQQKRNEKLGQDVDISNYYYPLTFNSKFEGGNLDAVYLQDNQYNLLLRSDTNTKGHCHYFNFRAKCAQKGVFRFKIVNMSKQKSLYQRGMRPYTLLLKPNQSYSEIFYNWKQDGSKVKYMKSPLTEQFQLKKKLYCLKFEYQFKEDGDEVQFCYGIPFTYSDLLMRIQQFRRSSYMHVGKLCYTLSGVQIPVLTIASAESTGEMKDKQRQKQIKQDQLNKPVSQGQIDELKGIIQISEGINKQQSLQANLEKPRQKDESKKFIVVITARVHPGQTHGSHILNGLIKALLEQKAQFKFLRKNVTFKIVPMLNPDGVIAGNTRTSFAGKDLNRLFSKKTQFVFPQVIGTRDYVEKLKQKYKTKLNCLIDLHGHSTRKNSFFFGPEFPVFDQEYTKCRLLPRLYSLRTDIFRYHSCKFRLAQSKQSTSRGYFNGRGIVRTYTHETSMHCFFDFQNREDKQFTPLTLQKLGEDLAYSIYDYFNVLVRPDKIDKIKQLTKEKGVKFQISQQANNKENIQQVDSQQLGSDRADSQSSDDDFDQNQNQLFFNKINENREYFYEQLLKLNGLGKQQTNKKQKQKHKKPKDKEKEKQKEPQAFKVKIQEPQILVNSSKIKIDWIAKANINVKAKNFQEYKGLSSVVFGGSQSALKHSSLNSDLLYESSRKKDYSLLSTTKYSFLNFRADIRAEKAQIQRLKQYDQRHKARLQQFKATSTMKNNRFKTRSQFKQQRENNNDSLPKRFKLLEEPDKSYGRQRDNPASDRIATLLGDQQALFQVLKSAQLPLITQINRVRKSNPSTQRWLYGNQYGFTYNQCNKAYLGKQKSIVQKRNLSEKVLPRKKSIKNIRDDAQFIKRRIVKETSNNWSLVKKLPSLNVLATKKR